MGDGGRRVPGVVLAALAVALLALGVLWWVRAAPPASAADGTRSPASAAEVQGTPTIPGVVTVRLDDGRVLTYLRGRTTVSYPSAPRRYCRRAPAPYPGVRMMAPARPPVLLTRCG